MYLCSSFYFYICPQMSLDPLFYHLLVFCYICPSISITKSIIPTLLCVLYFTHLFLPQLIVLFIHLSFPLLTSFYYCSISALTSLSVCTLIFPYLQSYFHLTSDNPSSLSSFRLYCSLSAFTFSFHL